jgi:hypothetical protein
MALYKGGYNPKADLFKTVESQGGQAPPQWLGDHPNPGIANRPLRKKLEIPSLPPTFNLRRSETGW